MERPLLIVPPIAVIEGNDVGLFSSEQALCLKLEAPEVLEAAHSVFDSEGRCLELGVSRDDGKSVIVVSAAAEPSHQEALREALTDGLVAAFAVPRSQLEELTLAALVDYATQRFGFDD